MCQKPVLNPIVRVSPGSWITLFLEVKEGQAERQTGSRPSENLSIDKLVTTLLMLPSPGVSGVGVALVLLAQTLTGPLMV